MKFQTMYETNADYLESWKKLSLDARVERLSESRRGHLKFRFKGADFWVVLAEATSTLVIYWKDEKLKETYYSLLKDVLATIDGSPLRIQPSSVNIYNLPFPPPDRLGLLWCKKAFRYVRKKPAILPLLLLFSICLYGFVSLYQIDNLRCDLPEFPNQTFINLTGQEAPRLVIPQYMFPCFLSLWS